MLFSSSVIAFCAWLSKTKPMLAGFLVAMPLTTLLVLPLSMLQQNQSQEAVILFAKSILLALPFSLLFFVPFFVAERFKFSFWHCYLLGITLLVLGYLAHHKLKALL